MILKTERLYLREMYAYEGEFSDEEVHEWLDRQIE